MKEVAGDSDFADWYALELVSTVNIAIHGKNPERLGKVLGNQGLINRERIALFATCLKAITPETQEVCLDSIARTASLGDLGLSEESLEIPEIKALVDRQAEMAKLYLETVFSFKGVLPRVHSQQGSL